MIILEDIHWADSPPCEVDRERFAGEFTGCDGAVPD